MEYSWRMGEITEGFSWLENTDGNKGRLNESDERKGDGRGRATVAAMLLAVAASYFTGSVLDPGDGGKPDDGDGAAISVMSPGVMTEENGGDLWSSEREARIEELATAYIEEYMSKKYGECEP